MKKYIIILLFLSLFSCKKREADYAPENLLIGTWVSDDYKLQIPIKNTIGVGKFYNVTEINTPVRSLLLWYIDENGLSTTEKYDIVSLSSSNMKLIDEKNITYNLRKVK